MPPGDRTHYGTTLERCYLSRMWDEVHCSGNLAARREEIQAFNAANRYRKRGLAVLPTMYGAPYLCVGVDVPTATPSRHCHPSPLP